VRLLTYQDTERPRARLGVLTGGRQDIVLDLAAAHDLYAAAGVASEEMSRIYASGDMVLLLAAGEKALAQVRQLLSRVESLLQETSQCSDLMRRGVLLRVDAIRFFPVVPRPGKIVCVGLNFQSHIDEALAAGQKLPHKVDVPGAFNKVATALVGHGGNIIYPERGGQLDYEIELAMVIGRRCKGVRARDYKQYVAGFTISVDLSLRDVLFRSPNPFEAKNYDTFCPLGPALVTPDELDDPDSLMLQLWVNDELRQEESMANALFSCGEVLAYWSERMTFEPGDVILMGTPAGVGIFSEQPDRMLLKPGDRITAQIGELGRLNNEVAAASHDSTITKE